MIHHFSMTANNPKQVADVLAEILGGRAFPFPFAPNSYIAFANDDCGTAIEVYPMGCELTPATGTESYQYQVNSAPSQYSATHIAISVPTNRSQIEEIAKREGWRVVPGQRGSFQVVDLWVENRLMLELLPPDMTPHFVAAMNLRSWESLIATLSLT